MARLSKRQKLIREKVDRTQSYSVEDAVGILGELDQHTNFEETIDLAVNLGVDARKSDQVVRGSTVLPHGTGKSVRIAVFAQGENADKAVGAGADVVGMDDLAEQIRGGDLDFDVVIATPDAMRVVGQLGQILGPRGLMPNPKVGTVTADVETAVGNAKAGQVRFRTDKKGIVHCAVGKISFDSSAIRDNVEALLNDLRKLKPATSKGVYLKKVTLSSTMGPGIVIDQSSLSI